MPLIKIQQPTSRNNGKLQFTTGYTAGGAAMCAHLTRKEFSKRIHEKAGPGELVERKTIFYWETAPNWTPDTYVANCTKECGPGRIIEKNGILEWTKTKRATLIRATQITTGLPPRRTAKDGSINVVLALWKTSNYCKTNTYIPRWQIVNTDYYHANADKYDGWIELEVLPTAP